MIPHSYQFKQSFIINVCRIGSRAVSSLSDTIDIRASEKDDLGRMVVDCYPVVYIVYLNTGKVKRVFTRYIFFETREKAL